MFWLHNIFLFFSFFTQFQGFIYDPSHAFSRKDLLLLLFSYLNRQEAGEKDFDVIDTTRNKQQLKALEYFITDYWHFSFPFFEHWRVNFSILEALTKFTTDISISPLLSSCSLLKHSYFPVYNFSLSFAFFFF